MKEVKKLLLEDMIAIGKEEKLQGFEQVFVIRGTYLNSKPFSGERPPSLS